MQKKESKEELRTKLMAVVNAIFASKNEHPEWFEDLGIIIGHLQDAMNAIEELPTDK